jgi:hypothetical protein
MSEIGPAADSDEKSYFTSIEAEFIRVRGTPFLLSPKDFALMRRWRRAEIPLEDVLCGIEEAFARRAERGVAGRINSLSYCEGAVLEAWERRASARVGRGGSAEPSARDAEAAFAELNRRLEDFAEAQPRFRDAANRAQASLSRIQSRSAPLEEREQSLARLEKKLLREVESGLSEKEQNAIEADVDRRLAPEMGIMEAAAANRTRAILKRRKLRELYGVPALSLLFP